MQDLLLFPYSGTAIEALDCLDEQWRCIGFISDDETLIGKEFFGINVFSRTAFTDFPDAKVLAVHGSPGSYTNRETILQSLNIAADRFATVIHKNASISPRSTIGYNVLIMAGVVITANATIGNHVIVLPNSVIHHDSKIGDCTLIAANVTVAGNVDVGNSCYLGAASSIKNGITIGEKTLMGIGANVIESFPGHNKLVGNPARPLSRQ
ncbi:MAG TPA: NeuD/PglB/VioB family sugar acetyltransferase [Flavisolibacter sp.]|jgi:sugar O-acyltransferase (sialic acid O-acetyltransferase NeuD family)|nr:NeuD/PglB/VioB family sugar acetyltransferase [Flavisolibacter sp.]